MNIYYMMDINTLTSNHIFFGACVILACYLVFPNKYLYGLCLGGFIIYTYYYFNISLKNINNYKKTQIRPYNEIYNNYPEFIDFIYSIQEYYYYNPPVFEEILNNIQYFLKHYQQCLLNLNVINDEYTILIKHKYDALNALHSLIITIPVTDYMHFKLNKIIQVLQILFDKYLSNIVNKHTIYTNNNGLNINYKILQNDNEPKSSNIYVNSYFTYDLY